MHLMWQRTTNHRSAPQRLDRLDFQSQPYHTAGLHNSEFPNYGVFAPVVANRGSDLRWRGDEEVDGPFPVDFVPTTRGS